MGIISSTIIKIPMKNNQENMFIHGFRIPATPHVFRSPTPGQGIQSLHGPATHAAATEGWLISRRTIRRICECLLDNFWKAINFSFQKSPQKKKRTFGKRVYEIMIFSKGDLK